MTLLPNQEAFDFDLGLVLVKNKPSIQAHLQRGNTGVSRICIVTFQGQDQGRSDKNRELIRE